MRRRFARFWVSAAPSDADATSVLITQDRREGPPGIGRFARRRAAERDRRARKMPWLSPGSRRIGPRSWEL